MSYVFFVFRRINNAISRLRRASLTYLVGKEGVTGEVHLP